jgi:uncharacterized protein
MAFDWEHGGLAEGLRCYRGREFFLAHEHWEDVWRACEGPERLFLQALIQVAVAMHHFSRGNRAGAASLLRRSLSKLEKFPAVFNGVDLERLRESIRVWLHALDEAADPEIPAPTIR